MRLPGGGLPSRGESSTLFRHVAVRARCSAAASALQVPVEPLQYDLKTLHAVGRTARAGQLVRLLGEAHELDRPLEQAERHEEVLRLLDGAAQILLRMQDQERRVDALCVGRGRDAEVSVHVLEDELAEVPLE